MRKWINNPPTLPMYSAQWFIDFVTMSAGGTDMTCAFGLRTDAGQLPVVSVEDQRFGQIHNSLPWYGSLGGVTLSRGVTEKAAERRRLLKTYAEVLTGERPTFAVINVAPGEMTHISEYRELFRSTTSWPRRTQITHLPQRSDQVREELMGSFHQKARNAIRKGAKVGVSVTIDSSEEAWQSLHSLHRRSMQISQVEPKPLEHLMHLRQSAPAGSLRLALAHLDGVAIAALLTCTLKDTVEYLVPAVDPSFRSTQALSFLIWLEMLNAIDSGARWWHWGGTGHTQDSLFRFKHRLGGHSFAYVSLIHASQRGLEMLENVRGCVPTTLKYFFLYPFSQLGSRSS